MQLARVAQWIERHRPKVGVGGSSPSAGATYELGGGAFHGSYQVGASATLGFSNGR